MSTLKEMYKGIPNSPEATLTSDINASQTTITVSDANIIPEVPNILVIGGNTDNPETVKVTGKNGNTLTVERGFETEAQAWEAGTKVSRNFTAYDYNALIENIKTLKGNTDINADNILNLMNYVGNLENLDTVEKSNIVLALNEIYQDLVAHKAEMATQTTLGHVKAGQNITIDSDGTINAKGGNVDSVNGKTGEVVIDVPDIEGLVSSTLALGGSASAGGESAVALGQNASATGIYSVALGTNALAGDSSVALGRRARAWGFSVALGYNALVVGDSSVAIGSGSITENAAVALGTNALAGDSSVALGLDAEAVGDSSVALGRLASVENNNEGVLGGTGSVATSKWKVPGDFTVQGTKNFEIPHPKPEKSATHVIRHGAVESPTPGDTLYRYKIQATKDNDLVTIDLPDYFIWLNKDVQIFVTPQGHFGNGYGTLNRETEQLEIHCQFAGEYNVLVIGTRNDDHPSVQEWYIKGVEREIGESWTGETYVFNVDEIMEVEEIKEVSA